MKKLIYEISNNGKTEIIELETNRSAKWTENQYLRNRLNTKMKLIKTINYET